MKDFWTTLTSPKARKFWIAGVAVLLSLITAGLIPPAIAVWVTTIISGLAAGGVYLVPNQSDPTTELQNAPVEEFTTGTTMG